MTINRINSIMPSFLRDGDQIEIVAPAKFISKPDIKSAVELIQSHGFKVKFNKSLFSKVDVFAGTIEERIKNLQSAFNENETKAIFFARGGYGSIQIGDYIDFAIFSKNPKWLVGFSDITTILLHTYMRYQVNSIHGPMPSGVPYNFKKTDRECVDMMFNLLKNKLKDITTDYHNLNKIGTSFGIIIGGNLSILCSLIGSPSFLDLREEYILFIEDVDEYLYHLERMMYILDRMGLLKKLKGLIVGQMTNIMDNEISFGKTTYQLISDITKKYNYPICFDFPIGHNKKNHPIIIGAKVKLEVNDLFSRIHYQK